MPSINSARVSNSQLRNLGSGIVAVFVGGTSGIGQATCTQIVQHTAQPTVYIIGQNESRGSNMIEQLRQLNPSAKAYFLQSDLTLLRNVDEVCRVIKEREAKVNLLFMTANFLTWKGRDETSERLDKMLNLEYYARMRFVVNLLSHLKQATCSEELARVVSVLLAGREGKVFKDDLLLKEHHSFSNCSGQSTTMTSLAFERLSMENPAISFIHTSPGVVRNTNISKGMGPVIGMIGRLITAVGVLFFLSLEDSAEMHLYMATSDRYKRSAGATGKRAFRLDWQGQPCPESSILNTYLSEGMDREVWDTTLRVFEDVAIKGHVS